MSRCVRGALLLGDGSSNRKEWIENRIEELAQIFALGVGGFSVMDNHLQKLKNGRLIGRFFAASRDKLREVARRLNVRRLVNLVGCAAS